MPQFQHAYFVAVFQIYFNQSVPIVVLNSVRLALSDFFHKRSVCIRLHFTCVIFRLSFSPTLQYLGLYLGFVIKKFVSTLIYLEWIKTSVSRLIRQKLFFVCRTNKNTLPLMFGHTLVKWLSVCIIQAGEITFYSLLLFCFGERQQFRNFTYPTTLDSFYPLLPLELIYFSKKFISQSEPAHKRGFSFTLLRPNQNSHIVEFAARVIQSVNSSAEYEPRHLPAVVGIFAFQPPNQKIRNPFNAIPYYALYNVFDRVILPFTKHNPQSVIQFLSMMEPIFFLDIVAHYAVIRIRPSTYYAIFNRFW